MVVAVASFSLLCFCTFTMDPFDRRRALLPDKDPWTMQWLNTLLLVLCFCGSVPAREDFVVHCQVAEEESRIWVIRLWGAQKVPLMYYHRPRPEQSDRWSLADRNGTRWLSFAYVRWSSCLCVVFTGFPSVPDHLTTLRNGFLNPVFFIYYQESRKMMPLIVKLYLEPRSAETSDLVDAVG